MSKVVRTAPKRRIERVWSQDNDFIESGIIERTLHTVEDAKTLVRTIADIQVMNTDATADALTNFGWAVYVAPAGTSVVNPLQGASLDNDEPLQVIARGLGSLEMRTNVGESQTKQFKLDIKAMRKLKPGDLIKIGYIASTTNVLWITFGFNFHFKE